ncbi:hypothetical protein HZS_3787 [Henneguya salminicola]|nr:hypothetical protein HZS_3787 [Henneguya salminicola]
MKLFTRKTLDTHSYQMDNIVPTDINQIYIFSWENDKYISVGNDIERSANQELLFITYKNKKIIANPFHMNYKFMAVQIKIGKKSYVRTYPLYIFGKINFRIKFKSIYFLNINYYIRYG